MKNYIVLEVNGRKETLGQFTINTPNEYLLVNNMESILNSHIFEEFIDEIFLVVVNEISHQVDKKINNVYIAFINDNEEFICFVVIDKLKPKRGTYRTRVIDLHKSGYIVQFDDV